MKIKFKKSAFTLIELIAVVLVIGLLASVALPNAGSILRTNIKSGSNQFSAYLRAAYDQSVIRHKHIRVQLDFESGKYWTEEFQEAPGMPLLDMNSKIDDAILEFNQRNDDFRDEEKKAAREAAQFAKLETKNLKPKKLPNGVSFSGVHLFKKGEKVTQNLWIDFFPNGFATQSIVYLKNEYDDVYSVVIPTIGGRTKVEKGETLPNEI